MHSRRSSDGYARTTPTSTGAPDCLYKLANAGRLNPGEDYWVAPPCLRYLALALVDSSISRAGARDAKQSNGRQNRKRIQTRFTSVPRPRRHEPN